MSDPFMRAAIEEMARDQTYMKLVSDLLSKPLFAKLLEQTNRELDFHFPSACPHRRLVDGLPHSVQLCSNCKVLRFFLPKVPG